MDEGFEYRGHWWTSEEPEEKLLGILTFDPEEGDPELIRFVQTPNGDEGTPILELSLDNTHRREPYRIGHLTWLGTVRFTL